MTKNELRKRVDARKLEIEAQADKLSALKEKVAAFAGDVKGRSAVYALVKNLPLWKELEKIIGSD